MKTKSPIACPNALILQYKTVWRGIVLFNNAYWLIFCHYILRLYDPLWPILYIS